MRINEERELADLQTIKPQEIKLIKFCQGLEAEDRLYNLITEMDPMGWEEAKVIIRRHSADLVKHRPKVSEHVVNSISGASRSPSPSPGQQKKIRQ